MFLSFTIIQSKLTIIEKKLEEKANYVNRHCIMNRSLKCKQHWAEIKALHKASNKLKKQLDKLR